MFRFAIVAMRWFTPDLPIRISGGSSYSNSEREILDARGARVDDFLSRRIIISRKHSGERQYVRLYQKNKKT